MTTKDLFGDIDLLSIDNDAGFKEDSVREEIILPILHALGYKGSSIERSKALSHPFLRTGSKQRPITYIPDYSLKIDGSYPWVLDAKAPTESVTDVGHIEQVYSYATHPEIRSVFFALCNGKNFILFRREATNIPVLQFAIVDIEQYWDDLVRFLAPNSFHSGKPFSYEDDKRKYTGQFDYLNRPLPDEILKMKRQSAKRHKGVHGYFTRQSWNVVATYILNFTKPGDTVLDPFGGSGVTAIEAMMNERKAISIDINPLAVFIVNALIAPAKQSDLRGAFEKVKAKYQKLEPTKQAEYKQILKKYQYPKGNKLPKGSDVPTIEQLFTLEQLAKLALLKGIIKEEKNMKVRNSLLLAFSSSLYKLNSTYQAPKNISDGGGNSGVFAYYRYRVAPRPGNEEVLTVFENRFIKILDAKKEIEFRINDKSIANIKVVKDTATKLTWIPRESVDYIYTDPPYGKKIPYLDLSVMWTAWLDLRVSTEDYENEAIEGGEHKKTKLEYNSLIAESIREMYRVLKFDRWMSFVFAHKDPEFFHLIVETAESCGFEYVGPTRQASGHTTFKKKQNPFTVLSGQLIINFKKVRSPRAIMKANLGMNTFDVILQTIEGVIAKNHGATLEQINDELIIKGMELGFLDQMKKEYKDLTILLLEHFEYNKQSNLFSIREKSKFLTHVDVRLRIRYYLISFLRRMERERRVTDFDDIVLQILPLLRNGITPENQTILNVLEDLADRGPDGGWHLKKDDDLTLFQLP